MTSPARHGSDTIVDTMAAEGIDYIALNPGATLSGIHQSLAEPRGPGLVLALNEITAVSIADGYHRASGRVMAAGLHNLVGLQAGSMGIFNAWANHSAVFVVGGSGPRSAALRRPWIDWVHTPRDQAAAVRGYLVWDDEPATSADLVESIRTGIATAARPPAGPTYVAFDTTLQEGPPPEPEEPRPAVPRPATHYALADESARSIARRLEEATRPVIVADLVGRNPEAFAALVALAERYQVPVVDGGARHNFPTGHPLDATSVSADVLDQADLVLALDPRDGAWPLVDFSRLGQGEVRATPAAEVIEIGLQQLRMGGEVDLASRFGREQHVADTAVCLPTLTEAGHGRANHEAWTDHIRALVAERRTADEALMQPGSGKLTTPQVARLTADALVGVDFMLANGEARGWSRRAFDLTRAGDYLGRNVGAGLGYGVGASIGAALAVADRDTIVVNLQNDGDLLSTASSLWTAANLKLPILTVTLNNHSYLQDRHHQRVITAQRGRDLSTIGHGVDLDDPAIDLAGLARAQGIESLGPVEDADALRDALAWAVRAVVTERRPVLVDAWVAR